MIQLQNVTLFAYTGLDEPDHIRKTLKSLQHSASQIKFGAVKMIALVGNINDNTVASNHTHIGGIILNDLVNYIELVDTKSTDHIGYSRFFVEELVNHIDTDYCMGVQWDSSIINPDLWDDYFFNFDYIGAPWPNVPYYINRVGNGGFSIRSKRFLQISAELNYDPNHYEYKCAPEDWFLCVKNYGYMIERGIKFADPLTASRFSVEHPMEENHYIRDRIDTYQSFGFHYDLNTAGMEQIT